MGKNNRQIPGETPGSVYILQASRGGYFKIGRTYGSVRNRAKACGRKGEYIVFHSFTCKDTVSVERFLHTKFSKVRGTQERFYLCLKEALWLRGLDEGVVMQVLRDSNYNPDSYSRSAHLDDWSWLRFIWS